MRDLIQKLEEASFVDKTAANRGKKYSSKEAYKLKMSDPMGYLMAKYGEGAALSSREMDKIGLYDINDDWVQDALDNGDKNIVQISYDYVVDMRKWRKK